MNASFLKRLRLLLVIVGVSAVVLIGKYVGNRHELTSSGGLPVSGGEQMETRISVPLFKQNDPAWGDQKLGTTDFSMASTGCTVSALAMVIASKGIQIDPALLNKELTRHKAFTKEGLLIWSGVKAVTNNQFAAYLEDKPTHKLIDKQLSQGNPVIAKVLCGDQVWHWVLITGKAGKDYLIHDPLFSGGEYERMTSYSSGIYAIRYIQ